MTKYKLGDGLYGTCLVDGDEELYVVAAELSDGHYCDGCELPLEICACDDAAEYDEEDGDLFEPVTIYRNNGFFARLWRWLTA